jgi:hypothetical protein
VKAERSITPEIYADETGLPAGVITDQLIASLQGDARAAVVQLVQVVEELKGAREELSASRGFSRSDFLRWP